MNDACDGDCKASKESEAGQISSQDLLAAMGKYNEQLADAGVMLPGEGLQPTSKGKRVRFSGSQRTVIDGPFTETKELIAGYWLWQVKSMDDAVEWLKKAPFDEDDESRSGRCLKPTTSVRRSPRSCASRRIGSAPRSRASGRSHEQAWRA